MLKKVRKTVMSPILLISVIIAIFLLIGMFLLVVIHSYIMNKLTIQLVMFTGVLCLGGAIALFFTGACRGFTIITIDEKGISRSLFGRFFKLSMTWDEIYEISYFESLMGFIMFSQTKSIKGMTYWKITKIKNLIQLQLTQKNYDFIKQYIKQPIIGLTDAKMAQLKLKK